MSPRITWILPRRIDFCALETLACPALTISHDRDLLAHMNAIAELHADREGRAHLHTYEGNYDTYRAARKAEESATHRRVSEAKNEARKAERERVENQIKLDRNVRRGRDFERSKAETWLGDGAG